MTMISVIGNQFKLQARENCISLQQISLQPFLFQCRPFWKNGCYLEYKSAKFLLSVSKYLKIYTLFILYDNLVKYLCYFIFIYLFQYFGPHFVLC